MAKQIKEYIHAPNINNLIPNQQFLWPKTCQMGFCDTVDNKLYLKLHALWFNVICYKSYVCTLSMIASSI